MGCNAGSSVDSRLRWNDLEFPLESKPAPVRHPTGLLFEYLILKLSTSIPKVLSFAISAIVDNNRMRSICSLYLVDNIQNY